MYDDEDACDICGEPVDFLTPIPGDPYGRLACDDCLEEMGVITS